MRLLFSLSDSMLWIELVRVKRKDWKVRLETGVVIYATLLSLSLIFITVSYFSLLFSYFLIIVNDRDFFFLFSLFPPVRVLRVKSVYVCTCGRACSYRVAGNANLGLWIGSACAWSGSQRSPIISSSRTNISPSFISLFISSLLINVNIILFYLSASFYVHLHWESLHSDMLVEYWVHVIKSSQMQDSPYKY